MKRVAAIALVLLLAASARADWRGLKPGMNPHSAWECTGMPLMQYAARGTEMWTYDSGGYIQFENGRVTCWAEPKSEKPAMNLPPSAPRVEIKADGSATAARDDNSRASRAATTVDARVANTPS